MTTKFTPYIATDTEMQELASISDNIEVQPVQDLGGDVCEVCEPKDADFWSVYFHIKNQGVRCVADLPKEAEANMLASKLSEQYKVPLYKVPFTGKL